MRAKQRQHSSSEVGRKERGIQFYVMKSGILHHGKDLIDDISQRLFLAFGVLLKDVAFNGHAGGLASGRRYQSCSRQEQQFPAGRNRASYTSIFVVTLPATSVNRKWRPWNL